MNKKGESELLEFLMTYGLPILVVLAAIGGLAYLGVFNPGAQYTLKFNANRVCASDDVAEFLLDRVEAKLGLAALVELDNIEFHNFETDYKTGSSVDKVLWSVTCESDALICSRCDAEVEKDCGCRKMIIRHHLNKDDLISLGFERYTNGVENDEI